MKIFELIITVIILGCAIALTVMSAIRGEVFIAFLFGILSIFSTIMVRTVADELPEKETTSYKRLRKAMMISIMDKETIFWLFWSIVGFIISIILLVDSIADQNMRDIHDAIYVLCFTTFSTLLIIRGMIRK